MMAHTSVDHLIAAPVSGRVTSSGASAFFCT
jgi:hypothetical protein